MYKYIVKFYPELLKQREGLNLKPTYNEVKDAAVIYSNAGEKSKVKKGIDISTLEVGKDYIQFVLFCEVWLQQPTRSCKYFVQQLCKVEPYKNLINTSGRLFRGESEYIGDNDTLSVDDVEKDKLSDEEALIEVTRLFFRETKENREKIEKIKDILGGVE